MGSELDDHSTHLYRFLGVVRVGDVVVLDARLLVGVDDELGKDVGALLAGELASQRLLVGEEGHDVLTGPEDVEDARDQLVVVGERRIGLEAHVGAARLGRYVYGEVVSLGQQRVHRVAARIEQVAVEHRVREDRVDLGPLHRAQQTTQINSRCRLTNQKVN